jgi:ubiquinone biosynthesis protein UbiJ
MSAEKQPNWTEAEEALCQIEGGVDAEQIGRALNFTVSNMSRELQRARKALAYRAGGEDPEGGTNA